MLGTSNFTKSLIMFIFTLLLIANILYAFNINAVIGGNLSGIDVNADLSNSYFGISTFMDNWQSVYDNNSALNGLSSMLKDISKLIQNSSWTDMLNYAMPDKNIGTNILTVLVSIANTLFNLVWVFFSAIYLFFFLVYILFVIFSFLSFILTFISGFAYTQLPNTQFPDVQPLFSYVLNVI